MEELSGRSIFDPVQVKVSLSNSSTPLKLPDLSGCDEDVKIFNSPANISKRSKADRSCEPRKRSWFGCEECKKRRIKCDEVKPKCKRCRERGISCNYSVVLRFREDYVEKGKSFGREGVWSKQGRSEDPTAVLLSKVKDSNYLKVRNLQNLKFINCCTNEMKDKVLYIKPSLKPSIIPRDVMNLDIDPESLSFALSYYMEYISPIFNPLGCINSISNNFISRNVVIDLGLDLSDLIQYSQMRHEIFYLILSLGCVYLSKLGDSNQKRTWLEKSESYKKLGINIVGASLRSLQSVLDIDESGDFSTGLLLSLILLMLHEVADNCDEKWRGYLKACKFLVFSDKFISPRNPLEQTLLKFSLELLNYHESMGRTACKDTNSFFLLSEEVIGIPLIEKNSPSLSISWMGCDKNLVNIISDITDLSFERFNKGISEKNYCILGNDLRLKLALMNLEIRINEFILDMNLVDDVLEDVSSIINDIKIDPIWNLDELCFILAYEAKRLAALIYLECCIFNRTPEDREIQTMVFYIFRLLRFVIIQTDVKWCSTLLWSLFVVSAEISIHNSASDDLRYLTLRMLETLEIKSLGNVRMARDIILSIWKRRDKDNCDENSFGYLQMNKKKLQRRSLLGFTNDWEKYVANESIRISLA